jgi:hypothetical protein
VTRVDALLPPAPAVAPSVGPELPGTAEMLRSARGVLRPEDVPVWMTRGGGAARTAAGALAADAAALRRVGGTLRGLLGDAAVALGWEGAAAEAARARARRIGDQLDVVAGELDAARDALAGLAAALDAQHPVLGTATVAWQHAADPAERLGLVRRWHAPVQALDVADARAATAVHGAVGVLGRVRAAAADARSPSPAATATTSAGGGEGLLERAAHAVGAFCAETINVLASFGAAMVHHPDATAEVVAGVALMDLGITGRGAGPGAGCDRCRSGGRGAGQRGVGRRHRHRGRRRGARSGAAHHPRPDRRPHHPGGDARLRPGCPLPAASTRHPLREVRSVDREPQILRARQVQG